MGEQSKLKKDPAHKQEVLHRRKLFGGRQKAEEVFAEGIRQPCSDCGRPAIEYAIMWVSFKEMCARMPDFMAAMQALRSEELASKVVNFKFGSSDPAAFVRWREFYLCERDVSSGEKRLAQMMRPYESLGFLEWHRVPGGKDKAQSAVPEKLVRGPSGGDVDHGPRPMQQSAIVDANGRHFQS